MADRYDEANIDFMALDKGARAELVAAYRGPDYRGPDLERCTACKGAYSGAVRTVLAGIAPPGGLTRRELLTPTYASRVCDELESILDQTLQCGTMQHYMAHQREAFAAIAAHVGGRVGVEASALHKLADDFWWAAAETIWGRDGLAHFRTACRPFLDAIKANQCDE